jgi:flagellar hook protein FlgE
MGFGQGLSGLNAASQNLDVIGNNIANSGTVGFKSSSASFADVYASSRVGLGTQVAAISQRFVVGNVSGTGNQFDMAIDGEKGFFRVLDTSGNVLYTRNGQFFADENNNVVNAQGQRLTGFVGNGTTAVPITVPKGNIAPQATTKIGYEVGLDANKPVISEAGQPEIPGVAVLTDSATPPVTATFGYTIDPDGKVVWTGATPPAGTYTIDGNPMVIDNLGQVTSGEFVGTNGNTVFVAALPATPFDPAKPGSYSHSFPVEVVDSLGNTHELMQYFVKRAGATGTESEWEAYFRLDGKMVSASADGGVAGTGPVSMTFDQGGRILTGQNIVLNVPNPGGLDSPAQPMTLALDYNKTTQFGGNFTKSFTLDGYKTGEYASMSIAADGSLVANYTNGETQSLGMLVLADFNNLQGLQPKGGNAWAESPTSGQAVLGTPGTNGLALIKSQAVEESNVDMSKELVNMIIAQRTYQANAQTIKTQDQVLQTLINMR